MRRVLVTGGGSGIGSACADALAADWCVVHADVRAGPGLVTIDVADEASVDAVFAEHGPFDGLVCSAGIRTRGMIVDTPIEEWERHLRVNLTGTWLCIHAFLRGVPADTPTPRAIVTIASVNASIAVPGQAHYVASKGGVAALTRAAALEGAPHGVRVNAISAPGPIRTPMAAERLEDPDQLAWLTSAASLVGRSANRARSAPSPRSCSRTRRRTSRVRCSTPTAAGRPTPSSEGDLVTVVLERRSGHSGSRYRECG